MCRVALLSCYAPFFLSVGNHSATSVLGQRLPIYRRFCRPRENGLFPLRLDASGKPGYHAGMQPYHYDLYLEPDLESFRLTGRVCIRFAPEPGARGIRLDALDLTVQSCSLEDDSGPRECRWQLDDTGLSVETETEIAGSAELTVEYSGQINDRMLGFYRSRYVVDGETRYLAVTQFEEREARRAFPCVDEPAAKAVFQVSIRVPAGHIAVGNTGSCSIEEVADGGRVFHFRPTPPMSTYLLLFAVGPFNVETDRSWRIPIRTLASPGKGIAARQALTYARQSLSWLERFVGVAYPLSKLDHIAVTDFAFGAMENFGAVVYRENLLLVDDSTTRGEIESIMGVIAHETAHMWFGDLVSPAAWRYVWLNEAFATYFGNLVVEHWYPEWRALARFASGAMMASMSRDGLPGSVPIELESNDIDIDPSTAPIIYQKGGCILRMLHEYYGDAPFRAATHDFVQAHQYGSLDSDGFIHSFGGSLDRATSDGEELSARELLRDWVRKPGFPVLRVSRRGARMQVRQERFSYLSEGDEQAGEWIVPVTGIAGFHSSSPEAPGTDGRTLRFTLSTGETEVELPAQADWVKLNRGQSGYYRVFYEDDAAWHALGEAAATGALTPLDRYGIIADLRAFVLAGQLPLARYLDYISTYATGEEDPVVLGEIAGALTAFDALLPQNDRIRQAVDLLLLPQRDKLLEDPRHDEPYERVLLREPLLRALSFFEDADALAWLLNRAEAIRSGAEVHPDLAPPALEAACAAGDDFVGWAREQIASAETPEGRRIQLTRALAASRNESRLAELLSFVMETVPARNRIHFFRGAPGNPALARALWPWLREEREALSQMHPYHLASTVTATVPYAGLGREAEIRDFLGAAPGGAGGGPGLPITAGVRDLALERLEVNRRLVARERAGQD